MLSALGGSFLGQPEYLKIASQELESEYYQREEEAVYSMYCFWSGEAHLGLVEGVVGTEPGFMNGKEVVRVTYDTDIVDLKTITRHAEKAQCRFESVSDRKAKFRKDKDPQYYLKQTPYKYLALSPLQKTKINSILKKGGNANKILSPSQSAFLKKSEIMK